MDKLFHRTHSLVLSLTITAFLLYRKNIWTGIKDGRALFFCVSDECAGKCKFVETSKTNLANYYPSQVKLLCIRSVMRTIYLSAYFMYSDNVTTQKNHDWNIWH